VLPQFLYVGWDAGLPEDWSQGEGERNFKEGTFSRGGELPAVPPNVVLHKGIALTPLGGECLKGGASLLRHFAPHVTSCTPASPKQMLESGPEMLAASRGSHAYCCDTR
jgi:hypothetical protein